MLELVKSLLLSPKQLGMNARNGDLLRKALIKINGDEIKNLASFAKNTYLHILT
jgi:hypothetical protein